MIRNDAPCGYVNLLHVTQKWKEDFLFSDLFLLKLDVCYSDNIFFMEVIRNGYLFCQEKGSWTSRPSLHV